MSFRDVQVWVDSTNLQAVRAVYEVEVVDSTGFVVGSGLSWAAGTATGRIISFPALGAPGRIRFVRYTGNPPQVGDFMGQGVESTSITAIETADANGVPTNPPAFWAFNTHRTGVRPGDVMRVDTAERRHFWGMVAGQIDADSFELAEDWDGPLSEELRVLISTFGLPGLEWPVPSGRDARPDDTVREMFTAIAQSMMGPLRWFPLDTIFSPAYTTEGGYAPQIAIDEQGWIHMRGHFVEPDPVAIPFRSPLLVAKLPAGFAPSSPRIFSVSAGYTGTIATPGAVIVTPEDGGELKVLAGDTGATTRWFSLDGISYPSGD